MTKRGDRSLEKEAFWKLAVDEWRAAGTSIREFCRTNGLKESAFYFWRRELARQLVPSAYRPIHSKLVACACMLSAWASSASFTTSTTYADPVNTPTTFSYKKNYTLDTRGNRTQVADTNQLGGVIKTTNYDPNPETNVYDSIDGQERLNGVRLL